MAGKTEITCTILYTVYDEDNESGKGRTRLVVEQWNRGGPMLAKRGVTVKDNGEEFVTKAMGLKSNDLALISQHFEAITEALKTL